MFSHTDVKLIAHFDNNDILFVIFHGGGQYKASHAARGCQLNGFQPLSSAPEVPFQHAPFKSRIKAFPSTRKGRHYVSKIILVAFFFFLSSKYPQLAQITYFNAFFPEDENVIPGGRRRLRLREIAKRAPGHSVWKPSGVEPTCV